MPRSRPNAPRRPTEASTFRGQTNNVAAKEKEEASHGPNSNAGGTSPSRRAARKVVAKDATSTNSIANGRAKDDTKTTSDNRGATLKLTDIATAKTTSGSNGNSHIVTRGTTNRDSVGHPVGVDPAMSTATTSAMSRGQGRLCPAPEPRRPAWTTDHHEPSRAARRWSRPSTHAVEIPTSSFSASSTA